jgi:hypothetical protein
MNFPKTKPVYDKEMEPGKAREARFPSFERTDCHLETGTADGE